jgi:hypothetical protein
LKFLRIDDFLFGTDLSDFYDKISDLFLKFFQELRFFLKLFKYLRFFQRSYVAIRMALMLHDAHIANINIF